MQIDAGIGGGGYCEPLIGVVIFGKDISGQSSDVGKNTGGLWKTLLMMLLGSLEMTLLQKLLFLWLARISSKQFLTKLNLSENELKDEGAVIITKALEEGHGQLNEVDLSINLITWSGAKVVAEAVVQKRGFKLLNINANFISEEGITPFFSLNRQQNRD
ncbi:hypothetical protein KIW84_072726 [Lathyrus oleraceus]|uniref:Uncharacterized protein n=1 Tax=Pisum sativum TaxID=3888 RepID=A0A9D4VP94_PEA|nr:hypothetical protein KIW84_072724 [Pisum sativum]KAI5386296.1 hypothetical protein KIW84_072726 [Pisum sativum]